MLAQPDIDPPGGCAPGIHTGTNGKPNDQPEHGRKLVLAVLRAHDVAKHAGQLTNSKPQQS